MKISFALLLLLIGCHSSPREKEITDLHHHLSEAQHDIAKMPIYADPATGDYEDLRHGKFLLQDSVFLRGIVNHKDSLEPFIVQHIDSAPSFMYLAAYLKYQSAVPLIKHALLRGDYFQYYGWEEDPQEYRTTAMICNDQLRDHEYPYQMAAIAAIEYISGKPFAQAVSLSKEEEQKLAEESRTCRPDSMEENERGYQQSCLSLWLLSKFKGVPPPHF